MLEAARCRMAHLYVDAKLDQTHWPGGACSNILQAFSTRGDYNNRRLLVRAVTSRTALVIGNDTTFPWVWVGISKLATLSCHRAQDAPFRRLPARRCHLEAIHTRVR